jgi:hypothetical protein
MIAGRSGSSSPTKTAYRDTRFWRQAGIGVMQVLEKIESWSF